MGRARKLILCIEDDRETAALIAEELIERGFDVHVAHDGREGFSAILRLRPDLVLSDISMPIESGLQVLKRLTAVAPSAWNMPFIFVTAMVDRDVELEARRLGADDFVTKPIDFDLLETVVRARLAGAVRNITRPTRNDMSSRELEALTWAARGKTSAEIAMILKLSKRTIDFHLDNARVKLGATTRIEAVIRAAIAGLIEP